MRIFIHNDDDQLVATWDGRQLYGSLGMDPEVVAFQLWRLSIKLMGIGATAGGFGFTNPLTDHAVDGGDP